MECELYINLQIPINSLFVIIFLVQELHVNLLTCLLYTKLFNKYFYMAPTMVLSRKFPEKIGPGAAFFHGVWVLRLKNSQKTTFVNNHTEGRSLFVIEVETLWAGPQSGAWFQPKPLVGRLKLSGGDQNSIEI